MFEVFPIELSSRADVARLACALEKAPRPVFTLTTEGGYAVGSIVDWMDDRPIFLYHMETDRPGDYLCYRADELKEEGFYSHSAEKLPTMCAPVVRLKAPLSARGPEEDLKLTPLEVEDLPSLAKVGIYRMLLDEPPAPLFYMPSSGGDGGGGIYGVLSRISDDDGSTLFLYSRGDEPPASFIKVDPDRMGQVGFSRTTSEPGYVYLKLIRFMRYEARMLSTDHQ